MGLPSKEYESTTEEFGETKLNPQRIPYFFSVYTYRNPQFYGLSEEFFFGTDVKCNRPLRWALPVFTLQRKHFELIVSACASQCNQMQANTSICSPDANAEKFDFAYMFTVSWRNKDVYTVFVPILWLASLPKARLKEQSTVVYCVLTTLLIITRKTQGK